MSKKKKVVVSTNKKQDKKLAKTTATPKRRVRKVSQESQTIFGKDTYKFMLIGIGVIFIGMFLMAGGGQDPKVWDDSVIYSPIRITVAPILILLGLGLNIYAIFRPKQKEETTEEA